MYCIIQVHVYMYTCIQVGACQLMKLMPHLAALWGYPACM